MTARRSRGLTLRQFWSRYVRLPGPEGALVCPIPHAGQAAFLDAADARDAAGGRRYRALFLDWSKKASKSFCGAVWALRHVLADPDCREHPRLVGLAAWDEAQTAVVFDQIRRLVDTHPVLAERVKLLRGEAVFTEQRRDPRTGATYALDHRIIRLARDTRGTHGLPFTAIVRDELHTEPDHSMSESLLIAPHAPDGQTLVLSYQAPTTMHRPGVPLHDLRQRIAQGDPTVWHSYIGGRGEHAPWRVVPWITEAWVAEQERALAAAPSRFLRVVLNLPAGEAGGLLTTTELRDALVPGAEPERGEPGMRYYAALDLGATFDETALLVGHLATGGRLVVDVTRRWSGTPERPVSFIEVQAEILRLHQRFPLARLDCDQWQARQLVEGVQAHGVPARLVTLGSVQLDQLATGLKGTFQRRLVSIPSRDAALIEQLESVTVLETQRGRRDLLKLAPGGESGVTAHDDLAIALGMLIAIATKAGMGTLTLPPDFSACLRQVNGLSDGGCFLLGGMAYPHDPICAAHCKGLAFVKAAHAQHLAAGIEPTDIRTFRQRHVRDNDLSSRLRYGPVLDFYLG